MSTTPAQIAVALGRPVPLQSSDEFAQWMQWVDDARIHIRSKLGNLEALDQEVLDYVVRESVVAMVRRPDDATEVDIRVDDGQVSRRYTSSPGRVVILDDLLDMLRPATSKGGAFSVRPYSVRDCA